MNPIFTLIFVVGGVIGLTLIGVVVAAYVIVTRFINKETE